MQLVFLEASLLDVMGGDASVFLMHYCITCSREGKWGLPGLTSSDRVYLCMYCTTKIKKNVNRGESWSFVLRTTC